MIKKLKYFMKFNAIYYMLQKLLKRIIELKKILGIVTLIIF